MPPPGWWEALFPDPANILAAVGIMPGKTAVDLCSGDGWFAAQIAKVARRVIAIDIDRQLLEVARSRLALSGAVNAEFMEGDAYQVATLVNKPVDFVLLANAFHGVPDKPRLARAIKEILSPSGRLAIVNWHARPREETTIFGEPRGPKTSLRMSPEETIAIVQRTGLELGALVEIPPYHYGAVFRLPTTAGLAV
jgi:protein-L-isoaspartate O-methyltransferase